LNPDTWRALNDLGDDIERDWRSRNYSEDCFPDICTEHLMHNFPFTNIDVLDLASRLASSPILPKQEDIDARFGQPPVTLYRTERFYIALLYWSDSTTAIHEHDFQGAFRVVAGSSVHSSWEFVKKEEVSSRLLVGSVTRTSSEFLDAGEVRPILPGAQGAHALFHLERPSATLVVRTHSDPGASLQYSYIPPSLALQQPSVAPSVRRRIQLLRLLRRESEGHLRESVRRFVKSDDIVTLTILMLQLAAMGLDDDFMSEILNSIVRTHGHVGEAIRQSALERRNDLNLMKLRYRLQDDGRLALALILSGLDKRRVLDALDAKYGQYDAMRASRAICEALKCIDDVKGSELLPEIIFRLLQGQTTCEVTAHFKGQDVVAIEEIIGGLVDSPVLGKFLGIGANQGIDVLDTGKDGQSAPIT